MAIYGFISFCSQKCAERALLQTPALHKVKTQNTNNNKIPQRGFHIGKIGFLEWDHHHQGYVVKSSFTDGR